MDLEILENFQLMTFTVVCDEDESIAVPINKDFSFDKLYETIGTRSFIVIYEDDYFIFRKHRLQMTVAPKKLATFNIEYPANVVKFLNLLSTIIRGRSDVVVYMCGNTVSYDSPYFRGMGLDSVKSMRKGELREYVDEVTGRKIAVHYADATGGTTPSDKFFAFEDSKTRMITGGDWELEDWQKIKNKDRKTVLFRFFVQYQGEFLNCEIIADQKARNYIKVYNKPDPVRRWSDLCYTDQPDGSPYRPKMLTRTGVGDPMREVTTLIQSYFKRHQVYYTTNDAGEIMRNFIAWNKEEEEKAGY